MTNLSSSAFIAGACHPAFSQAASCEPTIGQTPAMNAGDVQNQHRTTP